MKSKNLSEKILRSVKSKGFKYIDLPSVIEANHIVQRSGETFRKFIFSFIDQNGSELCLRPDLTIASCLRYLENNLKGKEKIFYSGQAYRKSNNKGKEVDIGSICSGGQYNKLISRFKGVDIPGTGMSIGVDRLLFAMMQLDQIEVDEKKPVIICVMDEKYLKNYYEILKVLRDNNINSEIFLDSKKNLGKQLTYANKKQCPIAVICGENEFKDNTITLKNLLGVKGENNQLTFPKENLINEIKKFI